MDLLSWLQFVCCFIIISISVDLNWNAPDSANNWTLGVIPRLIIAVTTLGKDSSLVTSPPPPTTATAAVAPATPSLPP